MRERILKNSVVVYGNFPFLPVPNITISLMKDFSPFNMMPSVVQQIDNNGQTQQKLMFTSGESIQILFGKDRIDFVESIPESNSGMESFIATALGYLQALESRNLVFTRVALVHELVRDEITIDQANAIREKFVASAPPTSIEWGARWVNVETIESGNVNVNIDINKVQGLLNTRGKLEQFDGIRFLHDVGTSPLNFSARFISETIGEELENLMKIVRRQIDIANVEVR